MSRNTIFGVAASLELHPEPASGGSQGRAILKLSRRLELSAELLVSISGNHTVTVNDISFKIDPLVLKNPFTATTSGVGYLSPDDRMNEQLLQRLLKVGWKIVNPDDCRRHGYAFLESDLRMAEGSEQPVFA